MMKAVSVTSSSQISFPLLLLLPLLPPLFQFRAVQVLRVHTENVLSSLKIIDPEGGWVFLVPNALVRSTLILIFFYSQKKCGRDRGYRGLLFAV